MSLAVGEGQDVDLPVQPDRRPPADDAAEPPHAVRRAWRGALARAALAPTIVLAPLLTLAPEADGRFHIYLHGARYAPNPLRMVPDTLRDIPQFLGAGNFRPLGRVVEKTLDLSAFWLIDFFQLPLNIAVRVVSMLMFALLGIVVVVFAEALLAAPGKLFRQAPGRLSAVLPFAVAAGCVAAGPFSVPVMYGAIYAVATALVLSVAAVLARAVRPGTGRVPRSRALLALAAGAALAAYNEIAYLALPVATAVCLVRGRLVLGESWRALASGAAARLLGCLWLGFLPVFVLVRAIIWTNCRDGDCYDGSDLAVNGEVLTLLPARLVAWLPPLMWPVVARSAQDDGFGVYLRIAPLLALAALAWFAIRAARGLRPVDRRAGLAVAACGAVLVALGAVLASLNPWLQEAVGRYGFAMGWREGGILLAGGALILTGLSAAAVVRYPARGTTVLIVLLALTASVSAAANHRFLDSRSARLEGQLTNEVGAELADFGRQRFGNAARCTLQQQLHTLYAQSPWDRQRLDWSLDRATRVLHGDRARWCEAGPA